MISDRPRFVDDGWDWENPSSWWWGSRQEDVLGDITKALSGVDPTAKAAVAAPSKSYTNQD